MHLHDRFAEFLSASEIIEATPALLNDQRRRFVSSPDIVLQPNSVESVQKIMRFCFENRIRVTPQGVTLLDLAALEAVSVEEEADPV